jgi:hypothetical protein
MEREISMNSLQESASRNWYAAKVTTLTIKTTYALTNLEAIF